MNDNLKKILKYSGSLLVAVFFLYLALRKVDFDRLTIEFANVNWLFILIALFVYFLTLFARSEKWKIQIENLGYRQSSFFTYIAIVYHYFFNSFTIKLGPVARCTLLTRKKVPLTECLGTIVSEMVFDLLFLIFFSVLLLLLKISDLLQVFKNFFGDIQNFFSGKLYEVFIAVGVLLVLYALFRLLLNFYLKQTKFYKYLKKQTKIFVIAVKDSIKLKKFPLFILWNFILWALLFLMNFFLLKSVHIQEFSFVLILAVTVFTYYGWLLPTPGGIGSVEYFLLQAFAIFEISTHKAVAFGIIANALTFFGIIIIGSIATIFVGGSWKEKRLSD